MSKQIGNKLNLLVCLEKKRYQPLYYTVKELSDISLDYLENNTEEELVDGIKSVVINNDEMKDVKTFDELLLFGNQLTVEKKEEIGYYPKSYFQQLIERSLMTDLIPYFEDLKDLKNIHEGISLNKDLIFIDSINKKLEVVCTNYKDFLLYFLSLSENGTNVNESKQYIYIAERFAQVLCTENELRVFNEKNNTIDFVYNNPVLLDN